MELTYENYLVSLKVVKEMLYDRDFLKIDECIEDEKTWNEVLNKDDMITLKAFSKKTCTDVIVFWFRKNVELNRMKKVIKIIEKAAEISKRKTKGILIHNGMTNKVKSIVNVQRANVLSAFTLLEMQYNPTKHFLVSSQKALNKTKVKELLSLYNLTPKQLPKILCDDKIARWYDWKEGTIVKEINDDIGIVYFEVVEK